ncbi:hypothetical protein [Silvanigrella sp.]|jgi:hypothetical protein|uniref:hypothetical protein n=1 Tax=Silvanigrella sp. TaxID=2024976 RepID=UPI0037CAB060
MKTFVTLFTLSMVTNIYALDADKLVMEAYSADKIIKFYSCTLDPIAISDCDSKITIDHYGIREKKLSKPVANLLNSLRKEFTYVETSFIKNPRCQLYPNSIENFTLKVVQIDKMNPTNNNIFKFALHFNNCSVRPEQENAFHAADLSRALLIDLAKEAN